MNTCFCEVNEFSNSRFSECSLGKNIESYNVKNDISDVSLARMYENCRKPENLLEKIKCRNEELEGQKHPETGVLFEKRTVIIHEKEYEGVFPKFESLFDAHLPEVKLQSSDREQFKECNKQLKEAIEKYPELRSKFSEEQLEQIENSDTPDGYTWHHDTETGKMQLVDTEIHQKTGHTGGKCIWGGGSDNR